MNTTILRCVVLWLSFSAVQAFAVIPDAFREVVPNKSAKEIETFFAGVLAEVGPQEQQVLRDGLTWLEEYYQKQAGGKLSREQFLESLRGLMVIDVILHGYARHGTERQNMIDDLYERRIRTMTAADNAKTPEQRAELVKEAERLKATLDALVAERDRPSGLNELLAPRPRAAGEEITTPGDEIVPSPPKR